MTKDKPQVAVLMGSKSDWPVMQSGSEILDQLGIEHEVLIISAHRAPDQVFQFAANARGRGIKVIIAGAGCAAHLAGLLAAKTTLPVLGVPMQGGALQGLDAVLSTLQMPAGIPVGTLALGKAGAVNAALLAAEILALSNPDLDQRLVEFRVRQTERVLAEGDPRIKES